MMKNLFTLIMSASMMFACSPKEEQANVKMDYTLDWQTDHLHVSLLYTPTDADSTTLHYGEISYGGQADIFSCVKNFQGENCILKPDSAAREIKLYYEGTPTLKVEQNKLSERINIL